MNVAVGEPGRWGKSLSLKYRTPQSSFAKMIGAMKFSADFGEVGETEGFWFA
ncbi:hypothetical protein [Azospirillum sp. TSH64]|uniref:hypothetical protein n=1 Tax=Azospirillum sp. TSH64 TaxID=652740 RepID=UPI001304D6ED|nr:hypothetical protein [Azospirillum sp. TSH64]